MIAKCTNCDEEFGEVFERCPRCGELNTIRLKDDYIPYRDYDITQYDEDEEHGGEG